MQNHADCEQLMKHPVPKGQCGEEERAVDRKTNVQKKVPKKKTIGELAP